MLELTQQNDLKDARKYSEVDQFKKPSVLVA